MTLNDILVEISLDFDFTTSTPPTTSQEHSRRVKLINRFERELGRFKAYKWRFLQKSTSLSTTPNVATVSLPSDMSYNGAEIAQDGYVRFLDGNSNTTYYQLVTLDQVKTFETSEKLVWITGNEAVGYTLNINPTPTDTYTIPLNYFSKYLATDSGLTPKEVMTASTDITLIPNPMYLVYKTLMILNKTDDSNPLGNDYNAMANEALSQMLGDENALNFNQLQEIPDLAEVQGYPNIGD
jgi:hypothetical protein